MSSAIKVQTDLFEACKNTTHPPSLDKYDLLVWLVGYCCRQGAFVEMCGLLASASRGDLALKLSVVNSGVLLKCGQRSFTIQTER